MKKGFTLIELLAVIIILAVIALIATPVVLNVVEEAKVKSDRNSVYGLIDAAKLYYAESLLDTDKKAYTNGTTNVLDYLVISGEGPESGKIFINDKGQSAIAVVYGKVCFTKNFNEYELSENDDIENCELDIEETKVVYKDSVLNGTDPVIKENLIPVVLSNDGTVKKADIYSEWYNYTNKNWANAVVLKDKTITYEDNEEIPSSNIDAYFVWIPRYKYEIFNEGNYTDVITVSTAPTESAAQEVKIVFESKDVTPSTGSTVGSYLTHPAFTTLDVNGIWVAKFETSGTTSDIDVLPNVTSLRSINVKTMFEIAYNYDRNLDSHMMKNTEWGAVAYLSHSKYGINQEIRINNNSQYVTGCAATTPALNYFNKSQTDHSEGYYDGCENAYNTSIGYLASTTGNISGIYDISGGAWEYVASYMNGVYGSSGFDATSIKNYDNKYFDIYASDSTITSYNKRILGDATGELGPFYKYKDSDGTNRYHNNWYFDHSHFIDSSYSWFIRGGEYYGGVLANSFHFGRCAGNAYVNGTFRLVLS